VDTFGLGFAHASAAAVTTDMQLLQCRACTVVLGLHWGSCSNDELDKNESLVVRAFHDT
jgi:hypothetical protein